MPPSTALWFYPLAAFLFGINVGSFLNVCIYRMPRNCVTVNKPSRSFCPICRRHLRWYENQPLIGWLMLKGRCGGCKLKISPRYPIFELVTGVLWALATQRFLQPGNLEIGAFFLAVTFISVVIVAAMIDYDLRILPNRLTIPGMILIPVGVWFFPAACPGIDLSQQASEVLKTIRGPISWWQSDLLNWIYIDGLSAVSSMTGSPHRASIQALCASLAGLFFGAAIIWGISSVGQVLFGREVMGFGDVKYMGMLGAFLGVRGATLSIVLACLFGCLGGLLWKFLAGKAEISKDSYEEDLGPSGQLLLKFFRKEPVELSNGQEGYRFRGPAAFLARVVTGDSTIPFGPYLSLGALLVVLYPQTMEHWILVWWPSLLAGGS